MTTRLSDRRALVGSGAARIGIGAALVARPAMLPRVMGVDGVTARQVAWLSPMVGIRDVVLGAGLIAAVRRRSDPRPWLVAQAVSDTVDAVVLAAAVASRRANPVAGLLGAGLGALGAVAEAKAVRELR